MKHPTKEEAKRKDELKEAGLGLCNKCNQVRPLSAFYTNPSAKRWGYNPQCKSCQSEQNRSFRERDPDGYREHMRNHRAKKYGLSREDYDRLRDTPCEICGTREDLVIDHCHKAGHVRGSLCRKCNSLLGMANDDPALLQAAVEYLS